MNTLSLKGICKSPLNILCCVLSCPVLSCVILIVIKTDGRAVEQTDTNVGLTSFCACGRALLNGFGTTKRQL